MISPIGNQNRMLSVQSAPRPAKTPSAASSVSASPDSPIKESSESTAQESSETTAQKNTEALRMLSNQESTQRPTAANSNRVNSQAAIRAYQQSK